MRNSFRYAFLAMCLLSRVAFCDPVRINVEAEYGTLKSVSTASQLPGFSGLGYVGPFSENASSLEIPFTIIEAGRYHFILRYAAPYGDKINRITIDENTTFSSLFEAAENFGDLDLGSFNLSEGKHRLKIENDWGWIFVDALTLEPVQHPLNFEAEIANLSGGIRLHKSPYPENGSSGLGYVEGFMQAADSIDWIVQPETEGTHAFNLRYRSIIDHTLDLLVDGKIQSTLKAPASKGWQELSGSMALSASRQVVTLRSSQEASSSLALDRVSITGRFRRPVPVISVEPSNTDSQSYLFSAEKSYSTAESLRSFHWDFGDGQVSTESNARHHYNSPGVYVTTLETQSADGQKRFQQKTVVVGATNTKPRVVVCTDSEIDDFSTFIRYLSRSTDYETLGIVVGNSRWQKNGGYAEKDNQIWMKYIDTYAQVYPLWQKHHDGWPDPNQMKRLVKTGQKKLMGMAGVGPGLDTEGSDHIASLLLDLDERPVWVEAWGGTDDVAQALYKIKSQFPSEVARVVSKLKIFAITFQDVDSCDPDSPDCLMESGWWIAKNFPDLMLIRSHFVTAINYQHQGHPYSNAYFFSPAWLEDNIKKNHGPLGASYPQSYFSEGDAAAVFFFFDNGLEGFLKPENGSWGGRYEVDTSTKSDSHNFYFDAYDTWRDSLHDLWALARWLPAIQNDFSARMSWSEKTYDRANHEPQARIKGSSYRTYRPGEKVVLDASLSRDPDDSDTLFFHWWHYNDIDHLPLKVDLDVESDGKKASFITPDMPNKEISIVLEVRDNGEPSLVNYQIAHIKIVPN